MTKVVDELFPKPKKITNYKRGEKFSKFQKHQFICYDGEGVNVKGIQRYVYLAAYDGKEYYSVTNKLGLSSEQCFEFLVATAGTNLQYGINVIYGGSYDANMMLKDVDVSSLRQLHKKGHCHWQDWFIRFVPGKYFLVSHTPSKRSCQLWDVIGFFQMSFIVAIDKWLDVSDDVITKGKSDRGSFTLKNLPSTIAYCNTELEYFYALMLALWKAMDRAGIVVQRWDGAGSIASFLFSRASMELYKGRQEDQDKHYNKARSAYAGGRFELVNPGDYRQPIYCYDINSAYPYAIAQLPPFQDLVNVELDHTITDYDLCYVKFDCASEIWQKLFGYASPIFPFFHRAGDYQTSFPIRREGWLWGVEIINARALGFDCEVTEIWHWPDSGERPWQWVSALYDHRRQLKAEGDSAEKAIKLGLNSLYGKTAQQKGWQEGRPIPKTHQLYWAGWITAKARSMLFAAMMQNPSALIAVETDSIFSTAKLDLDIGEGLGQWDYKVFDNITYIQSGIYFADLDGKPYERYRGINKGALLREAVLNKWEGYWHPPRYGATRKQKILTVAAEQTRFRTLGTSLAGNRMKEWRQWITEEKEIQLTPIGKRNHRDDCSGKSLGKMQFMPCEWGKGHHHITAPVAVSDPVSKLYNVLWAGDIKDKEAYFDLMAENDYQEGLVI